MTRKEMEKVLRDNDFEIALSNLESWLSAPEVESLVRWVDKYKLNLQTYQDLCMSWSSYVVRPADLAESDPRYNPRGYDRYVEADAPEEAKKFFEIDKDYHYFGDSLPDIEFR